MLFRSMAEKKFQNLKSHDCHVIMTQLLPVPLRGLLPENVRGRQGLSAVGRRDGQEEGKAGRDRRRDAAHPLREDKGYGLGGEGGGGGGDEVGEEDDDG